MAILVVGLNHRTAPVEIREKLTLSGCALQIALDDLKGHLGSSPSQGGPQVPGRAEAAILSTCNRLEIYASTPAPDHAREQIEQFLTQLQNIPFMELKGHVYTTVGDDAAQHLMRVACGLESMILGEPQILGQVTQAFEEAQSAGATGLLLSQLFTRAMHAGKRARTETSISRFTTSVSHAGVVLLMEKLHQQRASRILIIGVGEMAILAAQELARCGIDDIAFMNRTYHRAEALAQDFHGKALTWYQLEEGVLWADAVICATGAPHLILYRHDVEAVLHRRENRPLVLLDMAVPRDVEDTVGVLPGVQYYDVDDLQSVVDAHIELRKAAIPQVEAIIKQEVAQFTEWYHGRQVTPVIKTLRERANTIAEEELIETLHHLSDADERTREVVRRLAHRLVNRLLHEPTTRLRLQASEGNGYGYAQAVRELFALNELDVIECQHKESGCARGNQGTTDSHTCDLQCILPDAL